MTIQMKAIEQFFHVILFITLYKVGLTFWGTIYHAVEAVQTFQSVDETPVCDNSNESY